VTSTAPLTGAAVIAAHGDRRHCTDQPDLVALQEIHAHLSHSTAMIKGGDADGFCSRTGGRIGAISKKQTVHARPVMHAERLWQCGLKPKIWRFRRGPLPPRQPGFQLASRDRTSSFNPG
jgi:hypothetical protein